MIDTSVKLFDLLLKMRGSRRDDRRNHFSNVIEPTFQAAERVFNDYMALFDECRQRIKAGHTRESIVSFLEERRLAELSVRARLLATLTNQATAAESWDPNGYLAVYKLKPFERGIWGLLLGGLGHLGSYVAINLQNPYYNDRHTLRGFLENASWTNKERLLEKASEQLEILEHAFRDVTQGYVELKASAFPYSTP